MVNHNCITCSGCVCILVYIMARVKRAFWLVRMKRAFWLVRGSLWLECRCTNDVMSHKVLCAQITKVVYRIYETIHNPQLLDSLWRRANARNVSFQCGQFTLSPQLVNPNFHKANRFHLAVRVYSDNTQKTWKRGENISHASRLRQEAYFFVLTTFLRHHCVIRVHMHCQKWNLFVNPLSPNSDKHLISPNNITTWSNLQL